MATTPNGNGGDEIGKLRIPVEADFKKFRQQMQDAPKEAKRAGEKIAEAAAEGVRAAAPGAGAKAGQTIADGAAQGVKRSASRLKASGKEIADRILEGIEHEAALKRGDLLESLHLKQIDRAKFEKDGRAIAEARNAGILKAIKSVATSGQLNGKEFDAFFVRMTKGLKDVGEEAPKSGGALRGFVREARLLLGLVSIVFMLQRVAQAFLGLGKAITDTVARAGEVQKLRNGFDALARAAGHNPEQLLAQLRSGTRGLVADAELLQTANAILEQRLPLTTKQLGELASVAKRLGDDTGHTAADALKRFADALASGEPGQVRALGLTTRMEDALKAWSAETGRSTDTLSRQQQVLIYYNALLDEARSKLGEQRTAQNVAADAIEGAKTAWRNLVDMTAVAIAQSPRVLSFLEGIGRSAEGSAAKVQHLANVIGAMVDTITEAPGTSALGIALKLLGLEGKAAAAAGGAAARAAGFDADTFNRRVRERDIQTSTDEGDLMRKKLANLQAEKKLLEDGVRVNDRRIEQLQYENNLIDQRLREIREQPAGRPEATGLKELQERFAALAKEKPSPETLAAWRALAADIRAHMQGVEKGSVAYRQFVALLGAVEKEIGKIGGKASHVADEREQLLRDLQERLAKLTATAADDQMAALDQLEARFRKAFGKNIPQAARDGLARLRADANATRLLEGWRKQLEELSDAAPSRAAAANLRQFIDAIGLERDKLTEGSAVREHYNQLLKQADEAYRRMTEAADKALPPEAVAAGNRYADTIARLREQLEDGTISQSKFAKESKAAAKVYNEAISELIKKLRELGKLTPETERILVGLFKDDKGAQRVEHMRELGRTIEENARAALELAKAFGVVDDRTAEALENLVQLGTAVARLAAGDMTALLPALSSAASLMNSLGGMSEEERRERVRQIGAMVDLTRALDKLRTAVLANMTRAERDDIASRAEAVLGGRGLGATLSDKLKIGMGTGVVHISTKMAPEDLDALRRLQEQTGANFLDESAGTVDLDALRKAVQAFKDLDFGAFGKDLEGRLSAMDFVMNTLGDAAGGAAEKLDMFLKALEDVEGAADAGAQAFADEFRKQFEAGGAAGAEAWINGLAKRLAANDPTLFAKGSPFEGLTPEQLRELIEKSKGILGNFTGAGDDGKTVSVGEFRGITEVQASRVLGELSTLNVTARESRNLLAAMLGAITGKPVPVAPAAAAPPPPDAAGGPVVINVQPGAVGPIRVDVASPDTLGTDARAAGQQAGDAFSDGFLDGVSRGIDRRASTLARARGKPATR